MKKIVIYLLAALSILIGGSVSAQESLDVQFEFEPLFQNADILPGDSVTRWIQVQNNTEVQEVIGIEAKNVYDCSGDPYCLADILSIRIHENANLLYSDTLSNFYSSGVVVLSDLSSSASTQYDVTIAFPIEAGDEYQALTTSFDFDIGFVGSEDTGGGEEDPDTGGGGGIMTGDINEAVLLIQKSGSFFVTPGGTAQYTLKISNFGFGDAHSVVVTDTLPAGYSFVEPHTGTVTVNGDIQTQTWDIDTLPAHGVETITYTMQVPTQVTPLTYVYNHASVAEAGRFDLLASIDYPLLPLTLGIASISHASLTQAAANTDGNSEPEEYIAARKRTDSIQEGLHILGVERVRAAENNVFSIAGAGNVVIDADSNSRSFGVALLIMSALVVIGLRIALAKMRKA